MKLDLFIKAIEERVPLLEVCKWRCIPACKYYRQDATASFQEAIKNSQFFQKKNIYYYANSQLQNIYHT